MSPDGLIGNWKDLEDFPFPSADQSKIHDLAVFGELVPDGMGIIAVAGMVVFSPLYNIFGCEKRHCRVRARRKY